MKPERLHRQHWETIEAERLARYRGMFTWSDGARAFYAPAEIAPGHRVLEFGAGPGHTAVEIARWVGPAGHVHALDINAAFVADAAANAAAADLADRVSAAQSDGAALPLPDTSVDRVTTRNTLIYVDDPVATLGEFRRVLAPGGRVHAIEGDWTFMVADPVPHDEWAAFVAAASAVARTPDIGRRLPSFLRRAGFGEPRLDVLTRPDLDGRLLPMIATLAGYAESGGLPPAAIARITDTLQDALAAGTYLVLAPQFVVTADRLD